MAGGEGTRLRPMTANQPKVLLPVGAKVEVAVDGRDVFMVWGHRHHHHHHH